MTCVKLADVFVKIKFCRFRYTVAVVSEINFIEITFQNLALAIFAFDTARDSNFFNFSFQILFGRKMSVFCGLLCDGGCAFFELFAGNIFCRSG